MDIISVISFLYQDTQYFCFCIISLCLLQIYIDRHLVYIMTIDLLISFVMVKCSVKQLNVCYYYFMVQLFSLKITGTQLCTLHILRATPFDIQGEGMEVFRRKKITHLMSKKPKNFTHLMSKKRIAQLTSKKTLPHPTQLSKIHTQKWSNSRAIIHASTQFTMVKSGPAWFSPFFLKGLYLWMQVT